MSSPATDAQLSAWLEAATNAADAAGVDPSLLDDRAVEVLLDLARDAAHGITRPAAPLATFAVGLALGRQGGDVDALVERAEAVAGAAGRWTSAEPPRDA